MMYDLLVRGARVYDGTGAPPFAADVGVQAGRITLVGSGRGASASMRIDADGLALAPGFIDLHSHADLTLPAFPEAPNSIQQGVATEVGGNCGFSAAPRVEAHASDLESLVAGIGPNLEWSWTTFAAYLDALDRSRPYVNVVPLVGHGTLRVAAMGFADRRPTAEELAVMRVSSGRPWPRARGVSRRVSTTRRESSPRSTSSWRWGRCSPRPARATTRTFAAARRRSTRRWPR